MELKDNNLSWKHVTAAFVASWVMFLVFMPKDPLGMNDEAVMAMGSVFVIALVSMVPFGVAHFMKRGRSKITFIASLLLLTTISLLGQLGFGINKGPENFDQCLIEEMRGQPASMGAVVTRECRRRFPD